MSSRSILVPVLLLTVFVQDGESVRCWACSSDLNPSCNDEFVFIAGQNSGLRLDNCDGNSAIYPNQGPSKSVCKKLKKYVNNQLVTIRGCTWKRSDDYTNSCPNSNNGANEVTTYCETCDHDACNGASAVVKTLTLFVIPVCLLMFK